MKYLRCLTVLAGLGLSAGANDVAADEDEQLRRIEVFGTGSVASKPDLALASLGVQTFAKTVQQAVAANNTAAEAVLAALGHAGIDPHRISTSSFNVSEQRDHSRENRDLIVGYRASNMVTVAIVDLDRVGVILQEAIDAGANNISNLRFTLEDPGPVKRQARINAVTDARQRAQTLATAANVELGKVAIIRETSGHTPVYKDRRMRLESVSAQSVPIQVDELEVTVQIEMVFYIE
jgi:uncharacterized protein YggE